MYNEVAVRKDLERIGLLQAVGNGQFRQDTVCCWGREYIAPVVTINGLESFGKIERYDSSRKLVFSSGNAVLKTGESDLLVKSYDNPQQKTRRRRRTFEEFNRSSSNSENGLPVVKPICIIHAAAEDEYLLVEPKGLHLKLHMDFLMEQYPESAEELELTIEALGRFFGSLRKQNMSYEPNIKSRKFIFDHMLRFDADGSYRLLLTDWPEFKNGYSPFGLHRKMLKWLRREASGNESLAAMARSRYRRGYMPDRSNANPVSNV